MAKKLYGVIKADLTPIAAPTYNLPEFVPLSQPLQIFPGGAFLPEEGPLEEAPLGGVVVTHSDLTPEDAAPEDFPLGDGLAVVNKYYTGTNSTAANLGPYNFTLPVPTGRSITTSSVTLTTTSTSDTDDGVGGWTSGTGTITYSSGVVAITFASDPGTGQIIATYTLDAP